MHNETSYTRARQNLAALLDQVTETREPVLIERRGKEAVALVAANELAGALDPDGPAPRQVRDRTMKFPVADA